LGTNTEELYPRALALWAKLRYWYSVVTMMTDQGVLNQVVAKSNIAASTAEGEATIPALNEGGGPSSIKK
jgi:hypothetical protein